MGDKAKDKRIRVGGDVIPGSIKREGKDVHFAMTWEGQNLRVVYSGTGPLPDWRPMVRIRSTVRIPPIWDFCGRRGNFKKRSARQE